MKLKFIILTLLVASVSGKSDNGKGFFQSKYGFKCPPLKNDPCTSFPHTTSKPATTTSDPCAQCRDLPISISDTWAGQCFPMNQIGTCDCVCGDVFCFSGEIIDRSTCTPNGRLQDCRCIPTSTVAPTTVPPTTDPFAGCEWCLNDTLGVGDTSAGYCSPTLSQNGCNCLCADLFCNNGQIIDRTTCVNGGSLTDCKCIDPYVTPSTSAPTQTTPNYDYGVDFDY